MNIEALKSDIIEWVNGLNDEQTLKELSHIKEGDSLLLPNQKQELDKRIEKYQIGETEFSDWEAVKNRVLKS